MTFRKTYTAVLPMHIRPIILTVFCSIALITSALARESHLDFITNGHQWPAQVKFKADVPGGSVFLTSTGFTYSYYSVDDLTRIHAAMHERQLSPTSVAPETVHGHAYSVTFQGCNASAFATGIHKLPNYYNYFLGSDASKWSGGMVAYESVQYQNIYRGIDLHVYSKGTSPKYDFVVSPHADASAIHLAFEGVVPELRVDGDLLIKTSVNEVLEKAPYAYQLVNGRKQKVSCRYVLRNGQVSFAFPHGYDHGKTLILDPALVFATYSGSTSVTYGWSATYDTAGNLYAGGQSFGTGWPVTMGAFQTTFGGGMDDGINKYSSNGSTLIYSTYYGGTNGDYPNAMIVNGSGELFIAGTTLSSDLAVTPGCFDNTYNGGADVYVARFNASATALLGATYLGGSGNEGNASTSLGVEANRGEVLTDTANNILVAFGTTSSDFPTTAGAYQTTLNGSMDGFVSKLSPNCSNLIFSTYIGGSDTDAVIAMQVSTSGKIIVGGGTLSNNFPGTSGGWQPSRQGARDGFIAVLNSNGSSLLYATYVGTAGDDDVSKVQLDVYGNIYAVGKVNSSSFPVSVGAFRDSAAMNFIAEFDSTLSNRLVSTTIGSKMAPLVPSAFLVDNCRNIYFIGFRTHLDTLASTPDAFQKNLGGFWMNVLSPNMNTRIYSSYFGAIGDHIDGGSSRLNPAGIVYHSMCTSNTNAPTSPSVWSPTKQHLGFDIASWKFNFQISGMRAGFTLNPGDSICAPGTVSFTNTSTGALAYLWDFGDGSTSNAVTPPPHVYNALGIYKVRLYAYNTAPCTPIDSDVHFVHVFRVRDTIVLIAPNVQDICQGDTVHMKVNPAWLVSVTPNTSVSYLPVGGSEIIFYPGSDITYKVSASLSSFCGTAKDSISFTIVVDTATIPHINQIADTLLCKGDTAVYQLSHRLRNLRISPPDYWNASSDSLTIQFFPPATTSYRLTGIGFNRCKSLRDTVDFTIHRSTLKAALELSPKETDLLAPTFQLSNKSKDYSSFNWYLNNASWSTAMNPSFTATDTGRYCFKLVATDINGCVDSAIDCGLVLDPLIYIPSAFSPNGDSKNDVFKPVARHVTIMNFAVYNRYGQRLFISSDARHGWDGTFHGKPCDLDVYFYTVRYSILNRDPKMLKGDVTLIR